MQLTRPGTLAEGTSARLDLLAPAVRRSLRIGPDQRETASAALGVPLPARIGAVALDGPRVVLCLGPDEWLVQDFDDRPVGQIDAAHSLVEISDRDVTLMLDGPGAAEILTLGCPRDTSAIPTGEARRTIFNGATVILWKDTETRFRLDCWRSFAPHVAHTLALGIHELDVEPALQNAGP